ncbi:MAG: VWA domain-containing protein [Ktedonobacteraceae bacterium]|nr:VWA domain-containing protein [Ktedonobacteraceae bacterium]
MLTFEQPLLLLLLLPVGLLVYLTWRRMSLPYPAVQRTLILISRLLLFTLVIAALAGASWIQPAGRQATIFVGDLSASTTTQRSFIEQWINQALKHKRPQDQVGIVAVGRNALVEQSVKSNIDFSRFESTPDTNYTDLAAGLRLASAILPADSERHIILLTDGQQNIGDALQEAQLLQQQGIRLDIVPLPEIKGPEARIDGLETPNQLRVGERFTLHLKVYSTVAQKATLRLYRDQNLVSQQSIQLIPGQQDVNFNLLAPSPGFHVFQVRLEAPMDTIAQNNYASAFINVQGPPRVMVVEGQPGSGRNIVNALKATHIDVSVVTPNDVPTTLDGLAPYGTVVLADVPALSLGVARMQALQAFVRDLGHGLVVSGGQNSYGPGGYANTPLEQTLPVRMDIPQHKDTPSIAVVLIIESLEAPLPVNISKEAAKGVVNLLTPRDQVGISAAYGTLTIPMQHVTDKTAINKAIDAMNPEDPPSYNPDLANAEQVLLKTDAKIKHVILLGDGDAFDNYVPQVSKMAKENITVSTVATNFADAQELGTMQLIASVGKGHCYPANDPSTIPQVLLKETERAARRNVINESFTPAVVGNHPILTGLNKFPTLDGYVATTPKTAAQQVMVSHLDDPVLAAWQYGLGRAVAWTSDALGQWTSHWLTWDEAARWWANLVTWTLPSPESAMNINGKVVNSTAQISVDLPTGTSANVKGQQQVQVHIVSPDLAQQTVNLSPTAPDHWEGSFPATQVGAYLLQVTWQGSNQNTMNRLTATTGLVVPYSPEYRTQGTDTRFLSLLARAGKGAQLDGKHPEKAFDLPLIPVNHSEPIVFWLLMLAALLLPIDIAARRLASLEFLTVGYQWLLARFRFGQSRLAAAAAQVEAPVISSLSSIREQRKERRSRFGRARPGPSAPGEQVASNVQARKETPKPKEAKEAPERPGTGQSQESTTSALLEAKRRRTQTHPERDS